MTEKLHEIDSYLTNYLSFQLFENSYSYTRTTNYSPLAAPIFKYENIFLNNSVCKTYNFGILSSNQKKYKLINKNNLHFYTKLVFNPLYTVINLITTKYFVR